MYQEENLTEESMCTICSTAGEFVEKRLDDFHESWHPNEDSRTYRRHTYDVEDFYFRRSIGQGSFSTVHCVFLKADRLNVATGNDQEAGQGFALKRLKANVIDNDDLLKVAAADLAIETTVLSSLNHKNIITLHGVKSGNMIQSLMEGSFFLVLDLLIETLDARINRWQMKQNRSMFQSIANKEAKTFHRIRSVALGIAKGMEYLHSMNIMFRDLKPTNIGFDEKDQVKIFDFGLAREISEDSPMPTTRLMTGGAGTPRYMAPEVAAMSDTYGFPADVYSFTILLWQIVTSKTPFASILSPTELATKVVNENKRPSLSKIDYSYSLMSLMESGWSADPTKRPTFSIICGEVEKILSQYDEGVNSDSTRRGCLKRTGSDSSGFSDIDPEPTISFNFLARRRNSDDGGSTLNSSKSRPPQTGHSSRRMSM